VRLANRCASDQPELQKMKENSALSRKNVATEMALNVLGYNLTRVMNIVGVNPLLAAMRA
jgi:hypothetical protein